MQQSVRVYRLRPAIAAGLTCLRVPVAVFLVWTLLSLRSLGFVGPLVIFVLAFSVGFHRVRRQTLTVDADGLVVQRGIYRLTTGWGDVARVERRRGMILLVDELVLRRSRAEAIDDRGKVGRFPPTMTADSPALGRIRVSYYDKHWRDGLIGEHLRARGVDLDPARPSRPAVEGDPAAR